MMNPAGRFYLLRTLSCDPSSLTPDVCLGHLDSLFAVSKTPAAQLHPTSVSTLCSSPNRSTPFYLPSPQTPSTFNRHGLSAAA